MPLYDDVNAEQIKLDNLKASVLSIPGWATWTQAEAEAWYSANIGTPLQADIPVTVNLSNIRGILVAMLTIMRAMGTMLWALARIVIVLRNKNWPKSNGQAIK